MDDLVIFVEHHHRARCNTSQRAGFYGDPIGFQKIAAADGNSTTPQSSAVMIKPRS